VNLEHLRAFLWLRWRLRVNQFKRAGPVNAVLFAIYAVMVGIASVGLLITGFLVGLLAMPHASGAVRLWVWDGIVIVFLFFWMIGLLMDVQRAEGLALDKVLHLPVSPFGGFLVNYLSSLFSLTLIAFVPGMVGLIIGEAISTSPAMLLGLPLVAAFMLAVTGVTYQFQGWLASLMTNPRRRRTIIVVMTASFILIAQFPNLINLMRPWEDFESSFKKEQEVLAELQREHANKKMTQAEFDQRSKDLHERYQTQRDETGERKLAQAKQTTQLFNLILPIGWFPLGAAGLPDNEFLPTLLGMLGLGAIGSFSLWRAYRTTVRLYTGQFTSGSATKTATPKPARPLDPNKVRLVERKFPWVSEYASAVAAAAIRSLTRAPEAKMMLIAPMIMVIVFGGLLVGQVGSPPQEVRPLIALGSATMIALMSVQLVGNQFGYDRTGFRAYVLCPAPRREILIGKNIAVAPLVLGLAIFNVVVAGVVFPMRIDHYPAAFAQVISMYLIFCLLANTLSILAPIPMAAGSIQPANVKMTPILMQMALLFFVFPIAMVPVFAPIGIEVLVEELAGIHWLPISLFLSLAILGLVVVGYRWMVSLQGDWLAMREKKILEVVTSKAE